MNNLTHPGTPTSAAARMALAMLAVLFIASAQARIPEPDFVVYGNATLFGQLLPDGTEVSVQLTSEPTVIATYVMGSDPLLGSTYALRIPMDSVDPRTPGTARAGELANVFIDTFAAGQFRIGEQGHAMRLDIDPGADAPNITVSDVTMQERTGTGVSFAIFQVNMSDTSDTAARFSYRTEDISAVGGTACVAGVDYLQVTTSLFFTLPAGSVSAPLTVQVCNDSIIEDDEQFRIVLSNPSNANLTRTEAVATIEDDDDLPVIQVDDLVFAEPLAGTDTANFVVQLSKSSANDVMVNYSTTGGSAIEGIDYEPAAGTAIVLAGTLSSVIPVVVNSDAEVEQNETFTLNLSLPVGARLLDTMAIGTLVDLNLDPVLDSVQGVENGGALTDMLRPSDVGIPQTGDHAYVSARDSDAIIAFTRTPADGSVAYSATYNSATSGFEALSLDGPTDIVVRPDGEFLYVTAFNDDAITVLDRNPVDGVLTAVGSIDDGAGSYLDGVIELAMSSDGAFLFAGSQFGNAVSVFSVDSGTGELTFVQSLANGDTSGGLTVSGLGRITGLTISPDNASLYTSASADSAVTWFDISSVDGTLTYRSSKVQNILGVRGISAASDVIVSPDGAQVLVSGEAGDSIGIFDRNTNTGEITYVTQVQRGDQGVVGMRGAKSLAMAGDGRTLTVAGFADDSLTVMGRDAVQNTPTYGDLAVQQTLRDSEAGNELLAEPSNLIISPDGQYLYVVASGDNAVSIYRVLNFQMVFMSSFEVAPPE